MASAAAGYKILVFSPTLSRSHMISNGRVADALAKAGHDVTLLEVEYNDPPDSVVSAHHAKRIPVYGAYMSSQDQESVMAKFSEMAFNEPNFFVGLLINAKLLLAWRQRLSEACA
ncbi:Protein UGT-46, partial [Aphelenchoides avenae]